MAINSIGYTTSPLGQAVQNLNNQLTTLSTQLATGEKSTTYAGMGVNEGFAIAARAQLANISAFTDTITNVNTIINAANTALQSLSRSRRAGAERRGRNAADPRQHRHRPSPSKTPPPNWLRWSAFSTRQAGNRYLFSGTAINTPARLPADHISTAPRPRPG